MQPWRSDNPLCRPIDRIERTILAGLIVAFLIAAPLLAILAVHLTAAAADREQRAQARWQQLTAVLTQDGSAGLVGLDGEWDTSWVTAQWTMPDGVVRTGRVAVALAARQGEHVQVWVTQAGQLTHPPLSRADVTEREIAAGALTPAALGVLLLIAGDAVRVLANRRRMADWTRAWEAAGPRWTSLR